MRTAIYIENGETQIVLTPETDNERAVLALAEKGKTVTIKRGSFYECRGGWYRQGMDENSVILRVTPDAT